MPEERLEYLLKRYFGKTCTEEERRELSRFILEAKDDRDFKELLEKIWYNFTPRDSMPQEKSNLIIDSILKEEASQRTEFKAGLRKMIWWRVAAAAMLVLIFSVGGYFIYFNRNAKQSPIAKATKYDVSAPNNSKARLTLGDGTIVYLDSTQKGSIVLQGNVKVVKNGDGQISYIGTNNKIIYNTLSNPRGSRVIKLLLSDGSKVWLNSGSSLRYPTAFIGNERKVEITGEAYFEVTHNTAMPFKVKKGDNEIKVLGTHFNVNAYDDEPNIKVTLVEGYVNVNSANASIKLNPGEQAQIASSGEISMNKEVNVNEVIAWTEGFFEFENMQLPDIMRQIARWYDVEVVYKLPNHKKQFGGRISRNLSLTSVLNLLERNGVHFKLEGNKITVL
jgi:ferric-dicitrate binding protein FerR (iron transport regulator)